MGKAYACKRSKVNISDLRESDFFETPRSCTIELLSKVSREFESVKTILEPCCGNYAISKVLTENGFNVVSRDLKYGNDFLFDDYSNEHYDAVVTNPPFSLWNDIVLKSRDVADKVFVIGKMNFFASHERTELNFWRELKHVWIFDRQIDYQFPINEDGLVGVGCLVSGFFEWEKGYQYSPTIEVIDMQKYCKLGSYEKWLKSSDPAEYQRVFGKK